MSSAKHDSELEAVESAFNTLALTTSDQALARVLDKLLPGLLAALSTKSGPARSKIIEVLKHINVRLRAAPSITLPFYAVLRVVSDESAALMTKNVGIQGGYVHRCYSRMKVEEKAKAAAPLIHAAVKLDSAKMKGNRAVLLAMVVESLRCVIIKESDQRDADFGPVIKEVNAKEIEMLLEFFTTIFSRTTKEDFPDQSIVAAIRFCFELSASRGAKCAARVYPGLLIAAADQKGELVSNAAEEALKRTDNFRILCEHELNLLDTLIALVLDPSSSMNVRTQIISKALLPVPQSANYFPQVLDILNLALHREAPSRLRKLGLEFVLHVMRNVSSEMMTAFGDDILAIVTDAVKEDCVDQTLNDSLRSMGLAALGEVGARVQNSESQDLSLPEFLFSVATNLHYSGTVRASACHALNIVAPRYAVSPTSMLPLLRSTLELTAKEVSSARHTAIIWANRCFPFKNHTVRLLNIIGCADERQEVREAASSGLFATKFRGQGVLEPKIGSDPDADTSECRTENGDSEYPDFAVMMSTISAELRDETLLLKSQSWSAFLRFSLRCLHATARNLKQEERQTMTLESFKTDLEYISSKEPASQAFKMLCDFAKSRLLDPRLIGHALPERAVLSVVLYSAILQPHVVADEYKRHLETLLRLCETCSSRSGGILVEALSGIAGLAASSLAQSVKEKFTARLCDSLTGESEDGPAKSTNEDFRVAAILTLGHIVAHAPKEENSSVVSDILGKVASHLSKKIESSSRVHIAAANAIATFARTRALPLSLGECEDINECANGASNKTQSSMEEKGWLPTRSRLFSVICARMESPKTDLKVVEAYCRTLGFASMREPEEKLRKSAVSTMINLVKQRKEDELRFSIGESLVRATTGLDITFTSNDDDMDWDDAHEHLESLLTFVDAKSGYVLDDERKIDDNDMAVENCLSQAITLCFDEKPSTRTGGCVILYTMIKWIGTEHDSPIWMKSCDKKEAVLHVQRQVSGRLPQAQAAFSTLLSERIEFTQQLAAQGITLVYNLSSPKTKEDLVHNLVKSLSSESSATATKIPGDKGGLLDVDLGDAETQRKRKSGSKTYKELCEIAKDVGKPELVYKMMELAAYSSLWNSRRGAALAGKSLLTHEAASKHLAPHIEKILPRLYILSFDPEEKTRASMSSILRAVVSASGHSTISDALVERMDSVLERCIRSIGDRQWRVREASCCALRDLLSGRTWQEIGKWLVQIWRSVLRAMDDIKESVRTAGSGCGRAVASLSIRLCDVNLSGPSVAAQAVQDVTPELLKMIVHGVVEIRKLGVETLTKLVDVGGSAMKGVLGETMSALLDAATELEPQALNYAQFHVEEKEQLDRMRAAAASTTGSFVMGSLIRLVRLVDEECAGDIVDRLVQVSRVGLGTATRAVAARLFTTLLVSHAVVLKPYSSKMMMAAAEATRFESTAHGRHAWASAAARAANLAPLPKVQYMINLISKLSISDSLRERTVAAALAAALWMDAPDLARQHGASVLPIAFIASHESSDDDKSEMSENWKKVWSAGVASDSAGLRIYASEIVNLSADRLETSPRYSIKASAASALGEMASALNSSSSIEVLRRAATSLLSVLSGRMWEGKEKVSESLALVAEAVKKYFYEKRSYIWKDVGGSQKVVDTVLVECKRGKNEYRLASLKALPKILECCRAEVDVLDSLLGDLESMLQKDPDKMDVDIYNEAESVAARQEGRKASVNRAVALIGAVESAYCVAQHSIHLRRTLTTLGSACQGEWEVRLAALGATEKVVARCSSNLLTERDILEAIYDATLEGLNDEKFSKVRRAALGILVELRKQCEACSLVRAGLSDSILDRLGEMKDREVDANAQADARRLYTELSQAGCKRPKV